MTHKDTDSRTTTVFRNLNFYQIPKLAIFKGLGRI